MFSKFLAAQKDLNTYLEDLPVTIMDISTFEAIPLLKQPLDWKNYDPLLTKNAEYGRLLFGPGIQFLYGPHNGYTGLDNLPIPIQSKRKTNRNHERKYRCTTNTAFQRVSGELIRI